MADDEYSRLKPTLTRGNPETNQRMWRRLKNAHHVSGVKPRATPDRASLYDGRK